MHATLRNFGPFALLLCLASLALTGCDALEALIDDVVDVAPDPDPGAGPTLSLVSGGLNAAGRFEVHVQLSAGAGVAALQFAVAFDGAALVPFGSTAGADALAAGKSVAGPPRAPWRFVVFGLDDQVLGDADGDGTSAVVRLEFERAAGASDPAEVSLIDPVAADALADDVPIELGDPITLVE